VDAGQAPDGVDAGQVDAGHADADAGRGQGDHGTVGVRTPWAPTTPLG
jgi:hypothetical protein